MLTPEFAKIFLYGKGVFTTVAVFNGVPFVWEKHWERLTNNAAKVGIDLSDFSEEMTRGSVIDSISENNLLYGRVRITFYDKSKSEIWSTENTLSAGLSVITGGQRLIPERFKLTVSPYSLNSRSPLAGIKSCNYLEKILALDEAKDRGFDEAIQLNDRGEVTSAAMANVFWLKGGRLYTPSLKTGSLPGTTRGFVLENIECVEVEATIDELNSADAIFLTSAGLGVTQVADYETKHFERSDHPILKLLATAI